MRPPISYYGGKQRLATKIVKLLPKHTVYVEPFAGGAAVLFAKPWPAVTDGGHYREVINDKDERLINFYNVLQDESLVYKLLEKLQLTPYSRVHYEKAKAINENCTGYSVLQRAWAYFVELGMSFSNQLCTDWRRGLFSENHPYTWARRVKRLPEYLERMAAVYIECDDALNVIKRWDSPQTCFYCDPPYPGAEQGHYSGYTQEDFNELVALLDTIKGSFVLSNYDQPGIPEHWERFELNAYCSAMPKCKDALEPNTKRTEVVWRVDRSQTVRPELQKLFDQGKFDCFDQPLYPVIESPPKVLLNF